MVGNPKDRFSRNEAHVDVGPDCKFSSDLISYPQV